MEEKTIWKNEWKKKRCNNNERWKQEKEYYKDGKKTAILKNKWKERRRSDIKNKDGKENKKKLVEEIVDKRQL